MPKFVDNLLIFGRLLRSLGLEVHFGRLLDLTEALQHVDVRSRDDVYFTCRALLVHRQDDLAMFEEAFDAFWRVHGAPHQRPDTSISHGRTATDDASRGGTNRTAGDAVPESSSDRTGTGDGITILRTWSDLEVIATKDFAEFTEDEIALARAAIRRLVWSPGDRRTRRWISGRGPRVDLRRALARSVRTGGDVVTMPRRRRRTRPRPIVLLCDVSGSMERYSRMLLHFMHAIGRRHRRVEAFLFSTQLTRVTKQLRGRGLPDAVAAVSRAVPDWSGGTRIGDALTAFHKRWTRVVLHGSPVVMLISDGWDRGDPVVLRNQVARLQRGCHRLIWLNPLIGTTDYAPLTRGLVASLPFVDDFLPARTLTNLGDLAMQLNKLTSARPRR